MRRPIVSTLGALVVLSGVWASSIPSLSAQGTAGIHEPAQPPDSAKVDSPVPTRAQMQAFLGTPTGTYRPVELAGSVFKLPQHDEILASPSATLTDALTGRIPGVIVMPSNGTTRAGSRIRIRGSRSPALFNDPVVYVDGIRATDAPRSFTLSDGGRAPSRLDDLDPNQIESIQILRGPSAATLVGPHAANGVIWIETRRGVPGPPRIDLYVEQGFVTEPTHYPASFLGVDSTGAPCRLQDVASGTCAQSRLLSTNPLEDPATNPFDPGWRQRYGLSVSGGTPKLTYAVGGDFEGQNGVVSPNALNARSVRANLELEPARSVGVVLSTSYLSNHLGLPVNQTLIAQGLLSSPEDEPPAVILPIYGRQDVDRWLASLRARWSPLQFLEVRGTLGRDATNRHERLVMPAFSDPSSGLTDVVDVEHSVVTAEVQASAVFEPFHSVHSTTTAGVQHLEFDREASQVRCRSLTDCSDDTAPRSVRGSWADFQTLGVFVEQRVAWRDRLFFSAGMRADDYSTFGGGLDVWLPNFGASWRISDEPFFPRSSLVHSLRLRLAYGVASPSFDPSQIPPIFSPTPPPPGTPEVEPEQVAEIEAGFDLEMFDRRLLLELSAYRQKTENLFLIISLAPSIGSWLLINQGSVRNRGIELWASGHVVRSEVDWTVALGASLSENEYHGPSAISRYQRHIDGFPLGGYWDRPIEAFEDADRNGIITQDEVTVGVSPVFLGTPFPTRQLALQNRLAFGDRVELRSLVELRGGHSLLNLTEVLRNTVGNSRPLNATRTSLQDQARAVTSTSFGSQAGYVEDASFWRLREVALTLHAPTAWAQALRASRLSLTVAGHNLAVGTSYTGLDPEVNAVGEDNFATYEFMTQPPVRRWTARLNVSF